MHGNFYVDDDASINVNAQAHITGTVYSSEGYANKNTLVVVVRLLDGVEIARATTNKYGYFSISMNANTLASSTYEVQYYGTEYPNTVETNGGDWETFTYQNPTDITTSSAPDVQYLQLVDWATTMSWASRAVIESYKDDNEIDLILTSGLTISENGNLVISGVSLPNTTYIAYSQIYDFPDGYPLVHTYKNVHSGKWAMWVQAGTAGNGQVVVEFSANPNAGTPNWWKWYDTSDPSSASGQTSYNFFNRNGLELEAGFEEGGNTLYSGNAVQVRTTIYTDGDGNGGYVDYHVLLADPDLY